MQEATITKPEHFTTTEGDDGYRPPTAYERAILHGLQVRLGGHLLGFPAYQPVEVYQGFDATQLLPARPGVGPARGLPARAVEDPRLARVDRWRNRNRAARRSRRANRSAAKR